MYVLPVLLEKHQPRIIVPELNPPFLTLGRPVTKRKPRIPFKKVMHLAAVNAWQTIRSNDEQNCSLSQKYQAKLLSQLYGIVQYSRLLTYTAHTILISILAFWRAKKQ
jgi:hypothetical protein